MKQGFFYLNKSPGKTETEKNVHKYQQITADKNEGSFYSNNDYYYLNKVGNTI